MAAVLIDKQIVEDEVCARCILHPLMYSEKKDSLKERKHRLAFAGAGTGDSTAEEGVTFGSFR